MKKAIRILVAAVLVMAMCATSAFAAAGPVVSAAKVTGKTGDTVKVEVSIKNNPGYASYNITMSNDEGLKLVGMSSNTAIVNPETGDAGFMSLTNVTGDAVLFTAEYEITGEAGTYAVTPEIIVMTNAANKELGATVEAGSVTVEAEEPETPVEPEKPDTPVVPEDPATPVNPDNGDTEKDPAATAPNADKNDGPKTGDNFSVALFGMVALAAAAAAAGTVFVRRRNN